MRELAAACLAGITSAVGGCTGLEPAAISAGASAAQTGATIFTQGKLTTFEPVRFGDCVTAVRAAGQRLGLLLRADEPGQADEADRRLRLVFDDERGQSIVVVVQQRTPTLTRLTIDVGTFGPIGMANLLLQETIERLNAMDARARAAREPPIVPGSGQASEEAQTPARPEADPSADPLDYHDRADEPSPTLEP